MRSGTPDQEDEEMKTREQLKALGKADGSKSAGNMRRKVKQEIEDDSDDPELMERATEQDQGEGSDKAALMMAATRIAQSKFGQELFCQDNNTITSIQLLPDDGSKKQTTESHRVEPFQMTVLRQIAPRPAADSPTETQVNLQCLPVVVTAGIPLGNTVPAGIVGGPLVYQLPPGSLLTMYAVPLPANVPKNMHSKQEDDGRPYIKKPPNAFMLFMKEHRPKVVADLKITDNALVNVELGQRWKSLLQSEKDRYIQEANLMRTLHEKQYPQWSSKENYGKKRKRIRKRRHVIELQ